MGRGGPAGGGGLAGVRGVQWGRGSSRGRGRGRWGWGRGRGQGTFHPPCHIVHYHMVLYPKGTSHNNQETRQKHQIRGKLRFSGNRFALVDLMAKGSHPFLCTKSELSLLLDKFSNFTSGLAKHQKANVHPKVSKCKASPDRGQAQSARPWNCCVRVFKKP